MYVGYIIYIYLDKNGIQPKQNTTMNILQADLVTRIDRFQLHIEGDSNRICIVY